VVPEIELVVPEVDVDAGRVAAGVLVADGVPVAAPYVVVLVPLTG